MGLKLKGLLADLLQDFCVCGKRIVWFAILKAG
jgi:hypothetical protein